MPLYEVAILEKPTKKEAEDGAQEKLILAPRCVVAPDQQTAMLQVVRDPGLQFDLLKAQILVRAFAPTHWQGTAGQNIGNQLMDAHYARSQYLNQNLAGPLVGYTSGETTAYAGPDVKAILDFVEK